MIVCRRVGTGKSGDASATLCGCQSGAAPATVSGEIAAIATSTSVRRWMYWEGAAVDEPEPGDLPGTEAITVLGRRITP